jgi:hypothetical protein
MTTLWNVRVESVDGAHAVLGIVSVSEDSGPFRDDSAFVLRLLYEPAVKFGPTLENEATGPLGDAISDEQIYNEAWVNEHAGEFVEAADLTESEPARATLAITMTDPRWLEHIAPGDKWRSAAYS